MASERPSMASERPSMASERPIMRYETTSLRPATTTLAHERQNTATEKANHAPGTPQQNIRAPVRPGFKMTHQRCGGLSTVSFRNCRRLAGDVQSKAHTSKLHSLS